MHINVHSEFAAVFRKRSRHVQRREARYAAAGKLASAEELQMLLTAIHAALKVHVSPLLGLRKMHARKALEHAGPLNA